MLELGTLFGQHTEQSGRLCQWPTQHSKYRSIHPPYRLRLHPKIVAPVYFSCLHYSVLLTQDVQGGNVSILGGHSIGHSKQTICMYESAICDKSVTTQNVAFLSYWYRKKRLQMHF